MSKIFLRYKICTCSFWSRAMTPEFHRLLSVFSEVFLENPQVPVVVSLNVKYVSTDTPSKLNSSECGNTIDIFVYFME